MKTLDALKRRLLLGSLALLIIPGSAMAGIAGTKHDFSTASWNTTGQICKVCHTPHKATLGVAGAPLWNHTVSSATYTMYSSITLDGAIATEPGTVSKLCLSCHDGTIALDNFGGVGGTTNFIPTQQNIGSDLRDDHPIGLTYSQGTGAGQDAELFPTSTSVTFGNSSTGTIASMLFSGKVECASCHDVHGTLAGSNTYLLVKTISTSQLCLTCHDK